MADRWWYRLCLALGLLLVLPALALVLPVVCIMERSLRPAYACLLSYLTLWRGD